MYALQKGSVALTGGTFERHWSSFHSPHAYLACTRPLKWGAGPMSFVKLTFLQCIHESHIVAQIRSPGMGPCPTPVDSNPLPESERLETRDLREARQLLAKTA